MTEVKTKESTPEATKTEEIFAHKVVAKFRKVAIYLVIVIVIAIAISIISERKEAAKIDSWNTILKATFAAQTTFGDMSSEIAKATKEIPDTPASQYGDMLVISAAGITYDKAKLELAKKAGEEFIKTNPKNSFINQVKLDYGTILFNLEDYEGAIKSYQEVINSKEEYLMHEALLYKALAQEKLGKDDEAIKTYTAVIDNINGTDKRAEKVALGNLADYASFAKTLLLDKKAKN